MPPTTEAHRAAALAEALRALPVAITTTDVRRDAVEVPSYPDEPRPVSVVTVHGGGHTGAGEHVGWTHRAHEEFRDRATAALARGRTTVADVSERIRRRCSDPYDRAALEAAVIDLALRQARASPGDLIAARPRPTRYVVSFAPAGDPARAFGRHLRGAPGIDAKIDVDPSWPVSIYQALADTGRVAVLDWKRTGTTSQHLTAHRILPDAIVEDPGPDPLAEVPQLAARRSIDGPFTHAGALDGAAPPFAANVKPARMGGVLEALDGVARCADRGIHVYFGGMFELGPARRQLLALAALLAPDAPNDIAPIGRNGRSAPRPERLDPAGTPGFGPSRNA